MTLSTINRQVFCAVLLFSGMSSMAAAGEAERSAGPLRIVAQDDHRVNPDLEPPRILGRQFWNLLPPVATKAMEKHIQNEPMVRDAARRYDLADLRAAGGDRLDINGEGLLKLQPDPRVPFVVSMSAGRPPFRCMDQFRIDKTIYEKWKREHPNFLGFWTGVEWDNEYITPLSSPTSAADWARKHGCSEAAIERMQEILARARASRQGAVEGVRECHAALRRYFFDDPGKMLFLRAGWCFDHYALEWGAGMVIAETTNTGPYRHQVSLFHVRGAARQYRKPWEWYIAKYYNGFDKSGARSVNNEPNYLTKTKSDTPGSEEHSGPGYGMSVSLNRRDMYLAYLSGASIVAHEDWPRVFCQRKDGNPDEWVLSPHGEAMKEWYDFTERNPDRGVSYAPVALLVPFDQGMPHWGGNPWSHFPPQRPDMMIDAFFYTVTPFSQDVRNGKEGCLANGPFGDGYDVLVPNPPSGPIALDRLRDYKVAILLGGFDLDPPLANRLVEYVRQGGSLVINIQQVGDSLPEEFLGVKRTRKTAAVEGRVASASGDSADLAEPYDYEPIELGGAKAIWTDGKGGVLASVNRFGQGRVVLTAVDFMVPRQRANLLGTNAKMPLVEMLMRQIVSEALPIAVRGDIEYGLNKVPGGWWVYLVNNKGVTKFTTTAEELDEAETATVTVDLRRLRSTDLRELRADRPLALDGDKNSFTLRVGPGDIRIVKIATSDGSRSE